MIYCEEFETEAEALAFVACLPKEDKPDPEIVPGDDEIPNWTVFYCCDDLGAVNASQVFLYIVRHCNSQEGALEFLSLWENGEIEDISFWMALRASWSGFDCIPHLELSFAMDDMKPYWEPSKSERQLPEEMTVYRGQNEQGWIGLSWTLDKETARGFAVGHRGIFNSNPVILKATIRREDVVMYITDRDENEIVLWEPPLDFDIEIEERPESRCRA